MQGIYQSLKDVLFIKHVRDGSNWFTHLLNQGLLPYSVSLVSQSIPTWSWISLSNFSVCVRIFLTDVCCAFETLFCLVFAIATILANTFRFRSRKAYTITF